MWTHDVQVRYILQASEKPHISGRNQQEAVLGNQSIVATVLTTFPHAD